MAANTTPTLAPPAFTLAGPAPTIAPLSRRAELTTRIHHAHVRAHIRRLQSLGRGLPSSTRGVPRRTRAVAHTIATTPHTHLPAAVPAPRRALTALILNGLPTPPATPSPAHTLAHRARAEAAERPLLPTRRSRSRAARTGFHGTGAGLSFGLDVFGDDEPVLTPLSVPVPVPVPVAQAAYFPPPADSDQLEEGEIVEEEEN
uniref:NmrA domain-containing protein n=1 Tax=Ganoderma boninense TaxID=34458 RepID=A0A5K1K2J2_9APHY|nr:NmrA domain-containing protein [Ganoderma boninense]